MVKILVKSVFIISLFFLFCMSFSIGFVKPIDYDIDNGKIDSFAKLMPGQILDISLLSNYNGEIISDINMVYDSEIFTVNKINYGDPFIDISLTTKDKAPLGTHKLTFYIKTNKGERVIDTYIQISTNLIKAQLFFVGNTFNLQDKKEIKIVVENTSDGIAQCSLTSNLSEAWIPYKQIELKPRETIEVPNTFTANNIGTYDIVFSCDNEYGNQFKLNKSLQIVTTKAKEHGFLFFAYPIINNILMPFYALMNYLSLLY